MKGNFISFSKLSFLFEDFEKVNKIKIVIENLFMLKKHCVSGCWAKANSRFLESNKINTEILQK
jgi:hypothetical protein